MYSGVLIPATRLTRPTFAAAPAPQGQSVFAARFRNAPAVRARKGLSQAAAAAVVAPHVADDAAVTAAKATRAAAAMGRGQAYARRLADLAVPLDDDRVSLMKAARAVQATGRARLNLAQTIRGRNVIPVADKAAGTVSLVDATSDPDVALAQAKAKASAIREPTAAPSYVRAALEPSPSDAAAAAALGTGTASPATVVAAKADAAAAAPISTGVLLALAVGAFLLLRKP